MLRTAANRRKFNRCVVIFRRGGANAAADTLAYAAGFIYRGLRDGFRGPLLVKPALGRGLSF